MAKQRSDYKSDLQPWTPKPDQTKDKIITWLYSRKDLRLIINKIAKDSDYLRDELISELFLFLCQKEEHEIIELYNRQVIDFHIISWISRQWQSTTSPFYKKIRKFEIGKSMTEEQQQKAIQILYGDNNRELKDEYQNALDNAIEALKSPGEYSFYHRDIIKSYLELGTISAVAKKYKIRPEYISQAISDAKEMLKGKISAELQDYLDNKIS